MCLPRGGGAPEAEPDVPNWAIAGRTIPYGDVHGYLRVCPGRPQLTRVRLTHPIHPCYYHTVSPHEGVTPPATPSPQPHHRCL